MKQRVLLVNKFYYRRGGDCVYLLNLEKILRDNGHEVAVYAMDYPHNITSEWSDYFASEISFQGGPIHKLMAAGRALGLGDINKSFNAMLDKFRPDVVHFNNIHSYLSPRIVQLAHRRAIRTVWTMHDYKLLCPSYSCLHDGKICESCIGRDKKYVLKNRCMKGSLAASVIAMIEAGRWKRNTLTECTDTFICPSEFIASKMRQDGFPDDKIVTLNNFIDPAIDVSTRIFSQKRDDYYVYIGRLSEEKGVETLLKAAASLPYNLKIAGDGPLADTLHKKYACHDNIEFLGHIGGKEVNELLSASRFAVVPSEWYENNPLSIIESLCAGTPVLGADTGGIPELITAENGMTFPSADIVSLISAIENMWNSSFDYEAISRNATYRFNPERYYMAINKIYTK